MMNTIAGIAAAVVALCGLLTIIYKNYLSPATKRRREALTDGKKAVDEGDISGIVSALNKLKRKILPIIFIFILAGCYQPKISLNPIEKIDIVRVPKGTQVGDWIAEKDGYFLSDKFFKDVMDAKVE